MVSFWQLSKRMQAEAEEVLPADSDQIKGTVGSDGNTPLLDVGENEREEQIQHLLKVGKQLDDGFWDNLIKITNNTDALSKLLGVPANQIADWSTRINRALEKLADGPDRKERKKLLKTGEGPIASQDQDGTEIHPSDMRPTP